MPPQDLPLDLVVLADLGLAAGHAALGRIHRVEPETFAPWMARLAPEVRLDRSGSGPGLAFDDPRAFRPESLATRVPDARALLELRQKVAQQGVDRRELDALVAGLPDGSPLKGALQAAAKGPGAAVPATPPPAAPKPAPAPAPRPGAPSGDDPLDAILGMVDVGGSPAPTPPGDERATPAATRALDRLVGLLGASRTGQASSATQAALARVVDEALGDTLRTVLRDPAFQALEQTWTGLRLLVRRLDFRSGVRLHVLATTREAAARHAREVLEPFAEDSRREARVVVTLADFDLAGDPEGLSLAAALAAVAAENQSPLVAQADPKLLGLDSITAIDGIDNVADLLVDEAHAGWMELRADEDARWLALTVNRFLMRLPYGAESDRVKGFAFEENPAGAPPSFLWGRGIWLIGERIAASYGRCGWGVQLTGQEEEVVAGDLPVRIATLKTGEEVPAPLEALLAERRALECSQGGLVALLCRRGGDFAFLAGAPMVHRAPGAVSAKSVAESRRDTLPFALFVAQVAAWVAHLESAGRFASEEERRMALAQGVQFLSMTGEGATLEAAVEGHAIRISPWRDPLRGLPDFTLTLAERD